MKSAEIVRALMSTALLYALLVVPCRAAEEVPSGYGNLVAESVARSYYVVSDSLYLVMHRPMVKAYGSFVMTPVLTVGDGSNDAMDRETDTALAQGDPAFAAANRPLRDDEADDRPKSFEVAVNMNFRAAQGGSKEQPSEADSIEPVEDISDPLEPVNRLFFEFNDRFYFWALKPAADAYSFFVPEWGRIRLRNMFDNIQAPVRMANAVLQFKMHSFGSEFARFVLNSTIGLAGLFDIASRHPELKPADEDFGQTLGAYGLGEGFYLVWPFFGPSCLRDTAGMVGDRFLDPVWYVTPLQNSIALRSFDRLNDTSFRIGDYEDIKDAAVDPYISIRDMYKQYRRSRVSE